MQVSFFYILQSILNIKNIIQILKKLTTRLNDCYRSKNMLKATCLKYQRLLIMFWEHVFVFIKISI